MHQYATDVRRWRLIAGIGAAAFLLTVIINPVIEQFVPESLTSMTILTVSGMLYYMYKYLLWLPVGWLLDSQIPNINGEWILTEDSAEILSTDAGQEKILIDQNWMEMQADYLNDQGVYLQSDSGKVSTSGANNPELVLTCVGEVPGPDGEDYQKVEGTFRLRLVRTSDTEELIGRYYNNSADNGASIVKFQLDSRRIVRRRAVSDEQGEEDFEFQSA